jgi:hypothetical protein
LRKPENGEEREEDCLVLHDETGDEIEKQGCLLLVVIYERKIFARRIYFGIGDWDWRLDIGRRYCKII